jgi:hypothetical protein
MIPELRNTPGANVMCHVAATATAYVSYGVITLNYFYDTHRGCEPLGNTFSTNIKKLI